MRPWQMARLGAGVVAVLIVVLAVPSAWAYRPFVSTDAAVADPKEFELELGVLTVDRTGHENTYTAPSVVLNYGVLDRWELVAEFRVQEGSGTDVTDPAVSLKTVLKEGVLQDKDGLSLAVESGLLLPSTLKGEGGVGFEATGIVSGRLGPLTLHANAGGGVDRSDVRPFVTWGLIGELPVSEKVRLVSEINGQGIRGRRADNAVLLGVIWKPSSSNVFVDAAVRRGISSGAPDWEFTAGVTFGFKLPSSPGPGLGSL